MTDFEEPACSAAALLGIHQPVQIVERRFAGIRASAELKGGNITLKISDGYRAASRDAVVGLCLDLFSKLLRRRVQDNAYVQAYRQFMKSQQTHALHKNLRLERGRKRRLEAQGQRYNLNEITARLVAENPVLQTLPVPPLGFSRNESLTRLGFYDEETHEIVISKTLDKKTVPIFVIEYVVFHELLHAKHPSRHNTHRRTVHPRAFRQDEKKYPLYGDALAWLRRNNLARQVN